MVMNSRAGTLFAAGLLAGAVVVAGVFGFRGEEPSSPTAVRPPALPATAIIGASAAPSGDISVDCSFNSIVANSGSEDGKVTLRDDLSGSTAANVSSYIVSGKEAAAAGRLHDAEANFLMACRAAQVVKPADALIVADAHYQLGRHYAAVAQPDARRRSELLDRAGALYASSLATYRARHGENHERTRFAAAGVAAVEQAGGSTSRLARAVPPRNIPADNTAAAVKPPAPPAGTETVAKAPAPAPMTPAPVAVATAPVAAAPAPVPVTIARAPAVVPAPAPAPAVAARPLERPPVVAAVTPPAVRAPVVTPPPVVRAPAEAPKVVARVEPSAPAITVARTRPSFDCGKARSTTEKLICQDDELAQADRDLGRLHARAKEAAPDRRAFQRRSDEAWIRREATCSDRECLRRWYAQRRGELQAESDDPPMAAARAEPRVVRNEAQLATRREAPAQRAVVMGASGMPRSTVEPPAQASGNPNAPD